MSDMAMTVTGVLSERDTTYKALVKRFDDSGYSVAEVDEGLSAARDNGWVEDRPNGDLGVTEAGNEAQRRHYQECG